MNLKCRFLIIELLCFVLTFSVCSCKSQYNGKKARTITVCHFLECLKQGNNVCVNEMFGLELKVMGKDTEMVEFDVKKASEILKKYGVPGEESFSYDKDPGKPNEFFYINIPIAIKEDPRDKIISATIRVAFLHRVGDDKIAGYEINTDYEKTMISPF